MRIQLHFNLWNYFFHVQLRLDSDAEAAVLDCANIYVHTRPGIDPYFCLSVSNPLVGWQKEWFFLRNNAVAPLPAVMGRRPVVQPSWGCGVAKKDTHNLQPVCDIH
jgi:hypothetical protein